MIVTLIVVGLCAVIMFLTVRLRAMSERLVEMYDRVASLHREIMQKTVEYHNIHTAVARHRNARGHDSCWLNDNELYSACGMEPPQRCLPPWPEFQASCARYYQEQAAQGKEKCSGAQELPQTASPSDHGEPDCGSCLIQCLDAPTVGPVAPGQGGKRSPQLSGKE